MVKWTNKKTSKNSPARAIINFLVSDENLKAELLISQWGFAGDEFKENLFSLWEEQIYFFRKSMAVTVLIWKTSK